MTAAPSMAEVLAEALRAEGIGEPGGDIHGWRCKYAEIYGPCDCFAETVRDVAQALAAAGYGHVASVEARAEAAEAQVAAVRRVAEEWGITARDGDFVSDDDFAEAIRDSGAWRLARDLRAALGGDQ